jgi:hypothetical protein
MGVSRIRLENRDRRFIERNMTEAIVWHSGEAEAAATVLKRLFAQRVPRGNSFRCGEFLAIFSWAGQTSCNQFRDTRCASHGCGFVRCMKTKAYRLIGNDFIS